MQNILLTVQSAGNNRLRLALDVHNSRTLFKCRGIKIVIKIKGLNDISCKTTCGNPCDRNGIWVQHNPKTNKPYRKKGYDLYDAELSKWLIEHPDIKLSQERSKRLEFKIAKTVEGFILTYVKFSHKPAHNKA